MASAASTTTSLPPEYTGVLRLAQDKVQAATQPGAFGNVTPILTDVMSMIPWIGIATTAALGTVVATRILISRMQNETLIVQ